MCVCTCVCVKPKIGNFFIIPSASWRSVAEWIPSSSKSSLLILLFLIALTPEYVRRKSIHRQLLTLEPRVKGMSTIAYKMWEKTNV